MNAFERAKKLRSSEFSLNPLTNKRKLSSFDDEDEDEDSDDSPDAQVARALQEEENAKTSTFDAGGFGQQRLRRRTRALRPILACDIKSSSQKRERNARVATISQKTNDNMSKRTKIISDSEDSEYIELDAASDSRSESGSAYEAPAPHVLPPTRVTLRMLRRQRDIDNVKSQLADVAELRAGSLESGDHAVRASVPALNPIVQASLPGAAVPANEQTEAALSGLESDASPDLDVLSLGSQSDSDDDAASRIGRNRAPTSRLAFRAERRAARERDRLESHHPEIRTMWTELENMPTINAIRAEQPANISRELKPFQLEGLSWMQAMEKTEWGGGLLGDEMGMGKTIQAVSLIMSDYPARNPSLVLIPPVALMQWQQEIGDYTDGTLKTFVFHGTNKVTKDISVKELKKYDVILMSYNSLESMFRHQEKGFKRKDKVHFQKSVIHQIQFHRVILDEAHNIKVSTEEFYWRIKLALILLLDKDNWRCQSLFCT